MSTSESTPSRGPKEPRRRPDPADSSHGRHATEGSRTTARSDGPEWTTERWKIQVEADARKRLKGSIRGIDPKGNRRGGGVSEGC